MGSESRNCPICQLRPEDGVKTLYINEVEGVSITCPRCGQYKTKTLEFISQSPLLTADLKLALSCATRQAAAAGQPIQLTAANTIELAAQHANTSVSDNQMRLLREIAKKAGRPGREVPFSIDSDFTLIDCFSKAEFLTYVTWVEQQNFAHRTPGPAGKPSINLTLTFDGWKQVQPLSRPGGIPGRCFVAMWFDKSMNEIFELGISKAVTDCGFPAPVRVDRKEHNNQITDEIMAGIRDAQFMIADFTGNRGGVYYEAGFARGLGRPVIHCCRDSDFDDRHFDTKIINHIKWSDVSDLRQKLTNRIKATIIRPA